MTAVKPLDPQQVREHLAEREAEIAAQRTVVEKLRDLADDEERVLWQKESQLAALKELLKSRGDL